MIFCIVFGSVLGDPGASQGLPKYIKIHSKCIPKSIYVLLPFFPIKNMPKCFQINAKTYPKSNQIRVRSNSKKHVFAWKVLQKSRFRSPWTLAKLHQFPLKNQSTKTINFLMDFQWFLEPFWHHFPLKIVTIIQSKTNAFFIRKINENWCQNDLIWDARGVSNEPTFRSLNLCWGQPGAQGDPRAPQGRPRHRPGSRHFPKWSSKCSNNDPKTTQEIPN